MQNGAGDPRLSNSAMAIGRDIIASINKAIDAEGLGLTTEARTKFMSELRSQA